jgi:hypothetical protein
VLPTGNENSSVGRGNIHLSHLIAFAADAANNVMCIRGTCPVCRKASWWGCSKHVPAVMDPIPPEQRYVSRLLVAFLHKLVIFLFNLHLTEALCMPLSPCPRPIRLSA